MHEEDCPIIDKLQQEKTELEDKSKQLKAETESILPLIQIMEVNQLEQQHNYDRHGVVLLTLFI